MAGRVRRQQGGAIRQLPSGRWQVRVREAATNRLHTLGTYATKQDANAALTAATTDQGRGQWVPPERGKITLGEYGREWLDHHPALALRSRERYDGLLRIHIAPHLGSTAMRDLSVATVRRWHSRLHTIASPDTAAKAYRLLRVICNTAVADGVIATSPCQVKGAGVERAEERPMATLAEVNALAGAVGERYRAMVLMAAWTGLRLGELTALVRADVDLVHGNVSVTKNRQRLDDGTSVVVRPKSAAGRRTVSIPPPLIPVLEEHLALFADPGREALVFSGEKGAPIDRSRWNARWRTAREEVGRPDLHFHDMRHVGNTLAAATGASTRELMARMGHASPRAALIYQHATQERDRAIAAALGELMTAADVVPIRGRDVS